MNTMYTIGELARAAGVAVSTLRYYERIKLLVPDGRTGGNYRVYGDENLARLRFIKTAQAVGFTLDDVRVLLGLEKGETRVCREVAKLIEQRLSDIRQRMKDLNRIDRVLKASQRLCRSNTAANRCNVMEHLSGQKKRRRKRKKT